MGKKRDVVSDLIEDLHELQPQHVETMDDTTLKALTELLLNWQDLFAREVNIRAMKKRGRR